MESLLGDCCGKCPQPDENDMEWHGYRRWKYVNGDLSFNSSGTVGPFFPLSERGWYKNCIKCPLVA